MRLARVSIEGFRSVNEPLDLPLDPRVTVLLGANDHGKSNLLAALTLLDPNLSVEPSDLNWSRVGEAARLPSIKYTVLLSDSDRAALKAEQDRQYAALLNTTDSGAMAVPRNVPSELVVGRSGVGSPLEVQAGVEADLADFALGMLPAVEIVDTGGAIRDAVTLQVLADQATSAGAFMRGIFHFAGIAPTEWDDALFAQSARSQARLARASEVLNGRLARDWTQGRDLTFELRHYSAESAIGLSIIDPAVEGRWVLASERSSGFTHFFTLKTLLHGRAKAWQDEAFVWLFDEPGTNLHPAGQFDLVRALEAESESNQVVYTTHSLFLVNRNRPLRHRLVLKDASGTRLDVKPYAGRWGRAFGALGLSVAAPLLFAEAILLTEGDSDPIYMNAIIGKLAESDQTDRDLNPLAIIATGDDVYAQYVLRSLRQGFHPPAVAFLFDGDTGGDRRLARIKRAAEDNGASVIQLARHTTIEDHLLFPRLLAESTCAYIAAVLGLPEPDASDRAARLLAEYDKVHGVGVTTGLCAWIEVQTAALYPELSGPSKVGIARQYALALDRVAPSDVTRTASKRARALLARVSSALDLPFPLAEPDEIID